MALPENAPYLDSSRLPSILANILFLGMADIDESADLVAYDRAIDHNASAVGGVFEGIAIKERHIVHESVEAREQILSGTNRQLQVLAASGLVPLPPGWPHVRTPG